MAIGNTGVSSLLRSANSAANALQTLQDTEAGYEWEYGPQDKAAHDKYSSYLQGRYSKLSGSSNPADLTKSIDFQKKLIDTDRTFRSNQIQLSTLATLNGSGSDLQKVDLLKNLAQQAYQNGDIQNGQSIEMMYDHALQALETKTTGGSSGGRFGSSSGGGVTASQTKTRDQNHVDIALANLEHSYQTGKPLAGLDANFNPTGKPAIGKDGKPVYITPQNYGQSRQQLITNKAQSYLDQINSGNDKNGTNMKDLINLYNNTDFKKTGQEIVPNGDGTLSIKQTGPAQGVYNATQDQGTAFKYDKSTGEMKPVQLGGTTNTLTGPDGKPIQGVGGSALSNTIYDIGRTKDSQFVYPRASSTTQGAPTELTFLDSTQSVNAKDKGGLLVGRDPKTGAYVLVGKNQQQPDGQGYAYHQVLLGDNGKPIYNAKDALAAAKKTNDYVTNSNEGVAPNVNAPSLNKSAQFIENGVGTGVKSAIGTLGKLGSGADRLLGEAGLNPGNVGNFLANPLVGFEGIGHGIASLLGLSHNVQTQQQIHQQQIQAAWQLTQQHIQAQQAQAQRAAQQQQLYQKAQAAAANAAKPGPRIQLTPAQQFASVAGPHPTAAQSARALQPALGLNYGGMLSAAGF